MNTTRRSLFASLVAAFAWPWVRQRPQEPLLCKWRGCQLTDEQRARLDAALGKKGVHLSDASLDRLWNDAQRRGAGPLFGGGLPDLKGTRV